MEAFGYNRFKPTTASLLVFQITDIFRSLTRNHRDSKERNAKHALIKLCRHKFCGCEVSLYRGSTIGLAGCGIWLIFVAIFGMRAENGSGKREFQLRAGAGFCFWGSGCENRKGKVAGYGILIFLRDCMIWPAQADVEMDLLWMKCVGFQVMNWSRKSSLHVKLIGVLLWCFVLISERGINSPVVLHFSASSAFLTFPTLSDWAFVGAAMISYG